MKRSEIISLKLDTIRAKADLVKAKALGFLAIAGGSWVYILKEDIPDIVKTAAVVTFALSTYGIILNFVRFGKLYTTIEELEDDIR